MNYIISLGIFQAVLTMSLFTLSKNNKAANHLLLWLLACIATHLSVKFLIFTNFDHYQIQKQLNTFIGLAYGPMLWLYACKVQNNRFLAHKYLLVFTPAVLAAVCYLAIFFQIVSTGTEPVFIIKYYNLGTQLLILPLLLVFTLMAIGRARKLSGFWVAEQKLIYGIAASFLSIIAVSVICLVCSYCQLPVARYYIDIRILTYLILLLVGIQVLYYKLVTEKSRSVAVAEITPQSEPAEPAESEAEPAPKSSILLRARANAEEENLLETETGSTAERQEQWAGTLRQLTCLMQEKQLYVDADFTLEKLSAASSFSRHHISETLNQYAGKNFYQYINEFRVQEIVKQLNRCKAQGIQPNMLVLAYEAGFKSKSSFNLYFKKITGHTPTSFLSASSASENHSMPAIVSSHSLIAFS